MKYLIRLTGSWGEQATYWSNEHGWTYFECATRFSRTERLTLPLPMGGVWEERPVMQDLWGDMRPVPEWLVRCLREDAAFWERPVRLDAVREARNRLASCTSRGILMEAHAIY